MASARVRVVFDSDYEATLAGLAAPKVARAASVVADAQRQRIPVSRDGSYGRPPGYAKSKIDVFPGGTRRAPHWDVGSTATTPAGVSYPTILDVGSPPHVIRSKGDYPLRNPRTGQVFGREVKHPGTPPTYWCRGSLSVLNGIIL